MNTFPAIAPLIFKDWGLISYTEALEKQLALVKTVAEENLDGFLIFCSHPPVVTLGRKTQPGDVFGWTGETVEISRGGRATYHGPSQLVIYPIINLNKETSNRRPRDIHRYLRSLEDSIVKVLGKYGIQSVGKSLQANTAENTEADETGVWVQNRKIASLGIGVKQWVTYHGAALNVAHDPSAFKGLKPCGFSSEIMTNMEQETQSNIDWDELKSQLKQELLISL